MLWKKISIALVISSLIIFHILTMYTDELFYYRKYMELDGCEFSVTKNLFEEPMIDDNDCGIPRISFEEWKEKRRRESFPDIYYETDLNITI